MSEDVQGWLTPRAVAAEAGVSQEFDLSQCVREPIHLLGGVQSYGALIAARWNDAVVDTVSRNAAEVLGRAAEELLGRPVTELIGDEQWALARESAEAVTDSGAAAPQEGPASSGVLPLTLDGEDGEDGEVGEGQRGSRLFDVTVHRNGDLLVLEFEPRAEGGPFVFQNFYPRVRRALQKLQGATDVTECCAAAVREIRTLTGYDRVVAYRFDGRDGPGQVIAEDRSEGREPWLDLWFPASDIPPQARRLYARNWIRVIGDVDDRTAGLVPELRADTGEPLDLSASVLRTVSGYHLEYLRNIGVSSSMSVSLLHEGELWGLIACHGDQPRRLSPEVRAACEFFGIALSLQLAAVAGREEADKLARNRRALATLLARLTSGAPDDLMRPGSGLVELLDADGAVLLRGTETLTAGARLPDALSGLLARLARDGSVGEVWSSDRLPEALGLEPEEAEAEGIPAGLLLLPFNRDGDLLAWWRREQPAPREWAADPSRPVRTGPGGERLTPRGSAAVYRATVRGRSAPWSPARLAGTGGRGVELLTRPEAWRLERGGGRGEGILDSRARGGPTDLLRGVVSRPRPGTPGPPTRPGRLTTVRRPRAGGADSRDPRGEGGLERARGRGGARVVAGGRLAEQGVTLVRPAALPRLRADRERLREVLENLLVNAASRGEGAGRRVWVDVGTAAGRPVEGALRADGDGLRPGTARDPGRAAGGLLLPRRSRGGGGGGRGAVDAWRQGAGWAGRGWTPTAAAPGRPLAGGPRSAGDRLGARGRWCGRSGRGGARGPRP
ncbi:GAF domain-containing protein [Streptomyces sp. JL1001]|uniref:GAF domain-containing protein n=1 Tax=Streptomyces sp. JL1001 TaxID=3078227 RepID=A0AAU8KLQ3_9ACTN